MTDAAGLIAFRESFDRCMASPVFFDLFYDHFLKSSPEVREKFRRTNLARQKRALKASLYLIAEAVVLHSSDLSLARDLSQLKEVAQRHSRSQANICPHLYALWLDSLLFAVKETDREFDARIEAAWRMAMQPGIDYITSVY